MHRRYPLAAVAAGGGMLAAAFLSATVAAADTADAGDGGAAGAGFTTDAFTFTPTESIADVDLGPLFSSGSADAAEFDVADSDDNGLGTVTGDADTTTIFGITNTELTIDDVQPVDGVDPAELPVEGTDYDVTSLPFGFEYVHADEAGGGSTDTVVTPFGNIDLGGLFDDGGDGGAGDAGGAGGDHTGGTVADASDILNALDDKAVRFGEGDGLDTMKFDGGDLDDAVQALSDDDTTDVLGDHLEADDIDSALDDHGMALATSTDFGTGDIAQALNDSDENDGGAAFGDLDAGRLGTALDDVVVHDDGSVSESDLSEALGDLNYDDVPDVAEEDLVSELANQDWSDADEVVTDHAFDGGEITDVLDGSDLTDSSGEFAGDVDASDIVSALIG